MLRLWDIEMDYDSAIVNEKALTINHNIWNECKDLLKECDKYRDPVIRLIPIKNEANELIAYGFQDSEANRELRMLKELEDNPHVLQFTDIFPEYKEVVLYGCNELSVAFAHYLEALGITVLVRGEFWDYFGYQSDSGVNCRRGGLVLFAEGLPLPGHNLYHMAQRSVSSEFECIDKIYETNVLEGKITDTTGSFEEIITRLKDGHEIILLGVDREAQDTYDLLCKYDVEIEGFAVKEKGQQEALLGKKVMSIAEAMCYLNSPVFLNCKDTKGALGGEWTEYFAYRGYERNRHFFLIKDYIEIPNSNLIHVFRNKNILLTGDERLCQLLTEYLEMIENDKVSVRYTAVGEKITVEERDILCLVVPDYHNGLNGIGDRKKRILSQQLSDMGFVNYTEYFISVRAFVLIDRYLRRSSEKYTIPGLMPKGIFLGRIPGSSGNFFFRGIMDGHPEILMIPYSDLNHNLFYYCIRLANLRSDEILPAFWAMYEQEACELQKDFPAPERFETCVKKILALRKRFTSQELFLLFHIAYAEMLNGTALEDISALVVYWEPHMLSKNEFPFLAMWLEDKKINGKTLVLRRNNIAITGSNCARKEDGWHSVSVYKKMFVDESAWDGVRLQSDHWHEFKMRFEDIKLYPRNSLMKICEHIDIEWSDNLLKTTCAGKELEYRGSVDFDLKPVFNKYEEFFSEFDRFRISIASSLYHKRYGFAYENCLKFSRRELQELFIKPFLFEEKKLFERDEEDIEIYEWMRWRLWEIRKHMVLNDIHSEFPLFGVKAYREIDMLERNRKKIEKTLEYIRQHDKMILYGTGHDCLELLRLMNEAMKEKILYSDKRAETQPYYFCGQKVIAPTKLCDLYKDYYILVTSSLYGSDIKEEFDHMGIELSRVYYNEAELRWR